MNKEMKQSVDALVKEKVIIFPAETLYGFSCSLFAEKAIQEVFKIKKREAQKQFITLVGSWDMAREIADITPEKEQFLKEHAYWPNHLTIVFRSKLEAYETIAVRFSKSAYLQELFQHIDFPIISTSVNYSNEPVFTDIHAIQQEFSKQVTYINPTSPQDIGKASTIINFVDDDMSLIREGEVPYQQIIDHYHAFRHNHK